MGIDAVITDPVMNGIGRDEGEFTAMWAALGEEVKHTLLNGPAETSWCNIGVTHDADTVGRCVMHRTVSVR